MWTITEDDGSMVSTHHSPSSLKQSPDLQLSFESLDHEPKTQTSTSKDKSGSPRTRNGRGFEEDYAPLTDYSQNSLGFFAESPAPSPIVAEPAREVFRSELLPTNHLRNFKRPQSANLRSEQRVSFKPTSSTQNDPRTARPSSANNIPMSVVPKLADKGRSASFGQKDQVSEPMYTSLNDLSEQRRDLDQLPRSERLVRRMGSPLGMTLLQLDERDMLLGRDESWHISNDGRIRSRKEMEVPRHVRKRDRDYRKEPAAVKGSVSPQSRRPLTAQPRTAVPPARMRPLSASPRVQRSEGWQDGGADTRGEWSESEVSGILEDDEEGDYGWLDESGDSDLWRSAQDFKVPERPRSRPVLAREVSRDSALASRVMALRSSLRAALQRRPLADTWDRLLDPARRGYFCLPELVQALSWANLSCTLLEAEELLGLLAEKRGASRVTFEQFQRYLREVDHQPQRANAARDQTKSSSKSSVSPSDLHSLLQNLELRASKLKLPFEEPRGSEARGTAQSKGTESRTSTRPSNNRAKGPKSIVLI